MWLWWFWPFRAETQCTSQHGSFDGHCWHEQELSLHIMPSKNCVQSQAVAPWTLRCCRCGAESDYEA
jgi:hypothetical protein